MMIEQLIILIFGAFFGGLFGYTISSAMNIIKTYELYDFRDFFCVFFEDHFFLSVFYGGFSLFLIVAIFASAYCF